MFERDVIGMNGANAPRADACPAARDLIALLLLTGP